MKYIPWILDLICVAVLAVNILSYYRKGFVKVIVSFVGFVAALVCGVIASLFLLITADSVSWLNRGLIEQSKLFSLAFHQVPF